MPFNDKLYEKPAINGEVGYPLAIASFAFKSIASALEVLAEKSGADITHDLEQIRDDARILREEFERMTGWTEK